MPKITTALLRCPQCTSPLVRRSHRRGSERLLSLLTLYPFRCEECRIRFWRLAWGNARRSHPQRSSSGMRPLRAMSDVAHAVLVLLTGQ
jgi:uncharacterized protein with PIN domain